MKILVIAGVLEIEVSPSIRNHLQIRHNDETVNLSTHLFITKDGQEHWIGLTADAADKLKGILGEGA